MDIGLRFEGQLDLTDIVYLEKAKLDLGRTGLTVVKGWNKNSRSKGKVRNGTGKSLMLSTLPNVLNSTSPAITVGKRSTGVKDSMFDKPTSRVEFQLRSGKHLYKITKSRKGKGLRYRVLKDGKDQKIPTTTKAEAYVKRIFPLSEKEFYTYVYLNGNRPFPLQMGSSSDRMQFFSDLFHLEQYDKVREELNARKRALRDHEIRAKEQRRQLSELLVERKDLGTDDAATLRAKLGSVDKKLPVLEEKLASLNALKNGHETYRHHPQWHDLDKEISVKQHLESLQNRIDKLGKAQKLWDKYQAYVELAKSYEKKSGKATELVLKYGKGIEDVELVERSIAKYDRKIAEYRSMLKPLSVKADKPKEVPKAACALGKFPSHDKYLAYIDAEVDKIDELVGFYERAAELSASSGTCLLCEQKVKGSKHLHKKQKELEFRRGTLLSQRPRLVTAKAYTEYSTALKAYEKESERVGAERDALEQRISKLELGVGKLRKALKGMQWLEANPKPKWDKEIPSKPKQDRDEYVKRSRSLELLLPVEKVLRGLGKISKAEVERVRTECTDVSSRISKLGIEKIKLEQVLERRSQLSKKIKSVKASLLTIEQELEDAPLLDALLELYSSKGKKLEVMKLFAKTLEQRMNDNAPLLFPEPMKFEFEPDATSFSIIVTRGIGKKAKTSDVRFLSGAESRQFNLCIVLSMLPLIPARRRTNIIVLDEINANLSEAATDLFAQQFLPTLQQVVPHVIVITPLDTSYPNAKTVTVVKEGHSSKLVHEDARHHH